MQRVRQLFIWLSRIHRCCGFGIQSPTDYCFVRYVVNEHWPYYQYAALDAQCDDWLARKLGRLYFRLSNWRQPSVITNVVPEDFADPQLAYLQAGCRRATVTNGGCQHMELVRVVMTGDDEQLLTSVFDMVDDQSVVLLEGINDSSATRLCWRRVVESERAVITFDLYYCGIVMFDKRRTKHHYVVNF